MSARAWWAVLIVLWCIMTAVLIYHVGVAGETVCSNTRPC